MAGMPLFAHAGREKLTPPFEVRRRRTGLVFACFAPQNRQ